MPFRDRSNRTRRGLLVGIPVVVGLSVAACGPFGGSSTSSSGLSAPARGSTSGGTLTALSLGPVSSWDPQRIGAREDMAFATRTFLRTLTAYAPSREVKEQSRLVGDLATTTGEPSNDLRTWQLTLRDGVTWQDGSPVTCDDVKYGISRTFATDAVTGGSTYALAMLDIPKSPTGASLYTGPYATGSAAAAGQAAYDRAVTCAGRTITFHLAAPAADFNETLTLPAFAPYPKARDRGKDGTYDIWSTGPYRLKDPWRASAGGTFVRNTSWHKDSDPIRKAYPDEIRYQEGLETQTVVQRIMADGKAGADAVSLGSAPPALQRQIATSKDLSNRSVNPGTGLVDYLAPNVKSRVFAHAAARAALALATDRDAYVAALGGPTAASPAYSLVPTGLSAHRDTDPVGGGTGGNPTAAAAMLAKSGLRTPVPITVAYRSTPTADQAMAALVPGWTRAGFTLKLKAVKNDYFAAAASPAMRSVDVFWSNWAPDWASASTVLPPLFDSRINLSAAGTGRDYGSFADPKVEARMTALESVADRTEREAGWAQLDAQLVGAGAYIALAQHKAMYIAGSQVRNLGADEAVGGYVEFADIGAR